MSEPHIEGENTRMALTLASISRQTIFVNARRICKREYQRSPNWVLAMELFGLGSTYAYAICREMGVDPDAKTAKMDAAP